MKKSVSLLILCIMLACFLTGCGGGSEPATASQPTPTPTLTPTPTPSPTPTPVDGYMYANETGVRWIKWTASADGNISGVWQATLLQNGTIQSAHGTVSGTQSGHSVTIVKEYMGQTNSATGTLKGTSLFLDSLEADGTTVTLEYKGVPRSAYDKAVQDFKALHS